MATSISYSSTASGGKTLSKSVTAINPNIDNAVAKTFTQKLNALTTNTLSSINRVDKTEIDPNKTYYDITLTKNTTDSSGTHIIWDAANPTKITVQDFSDAHEYLTLDMNLNGNDFNLDNGIPYIVERHGETNSFSIVVISEPSGICFDFTGGISGNITVTIPSGKTMTGNPSREYYFNGITFTIEGASD